MSEEFKIYLFAALYVLGGVVAGIIAEKVIVATLKKAAARTRWAIDDVIAASLRGLLIILGLGIGAVLAIRYLPGLPKVKEHSGTILFAIVVFLLTVMAGRITVGVIKANAARSEGPQKTSSIIANISRIAVYIIGFLIILQAFDVSITPLLTALGVGGLAVALALQDTLSNLFSGIQVLASKLVRRGDYIKLDSGEEGFVIDINWRNTIVRSLSDNLVIVPNSKMAAAILTNYSLPGKEMSVVVDVSVSYSSNLEKVEQVTVAAAEKVLSAVQGGVKTFQPFIRYNSFQDSGIGFSVILRAGQFTDQYLIKHEFVKMLQKMYQENAIEIPFPMRTVILQNQPTKE